MRRLKSALSPRTLWWIIAMAPTAPVALCQP